MLALHSGRAEQSAGPVGKHPILFLFLLSDRAITHLLRSAVGGVESGWADLTPFEVFISHLTRAVECWRRQQQIAALPHFEMLTAAKQNAMKST